MRPIPFDRSFYAEDAYGEIAHVEWIDTDAPFGPYVGVLNSDGVTFPVSDIRDWDDDRDALAARIGSDAAGDGPYCCKSCTRGTWNDNEHCDECEEQALRDAYPREAS